jgi:glycerol-3-phosphate acyltransferase PlsY
MPFDTFAIERVLAAALAGYLLGSIPCAKIAGWLKGVDIFTTGSRTAGTANVFWNLGRRTGVVVFLGDVSKGVAAVSVASWLGLSGPLVLVACAAAILGHWKSMFAGFKGGDGMATILGLFITVNPPIALMGLAVGTAVIVLVRRLERRSATAMTVGLGTILALSLYYHADRGVMLGLVGLGSLVTLRSLIGDQHRGRDSAEPTNPLGLDLDLDLEEDPNLGRSASEKP